MSRPAAPDGLSAEQVLNGRYQLVERLATGGMGQVWRARDVLLGRAVALKALRGEYVDDLEFLERFRAEARHTAALSHPGIAGVFDYGEVTDARDRTAVAFLVMELVEGRPLSDVLAGGRRLRPERAADLVAQTAAALSAAHAAGVVHRDVKPGNLLLRADGVVKVTDFGIARAADSATLTAVGTVLGTAYYLSPEQARGDGVSAASDVYSLGVVAFEALAGSRPFRGDDPRALARAHAEQPVPPLPGDVPPALAALVREMLAKDPSARPGSAAEVARRATALRDALDDDAASRTTVLPVAPPPPTTALPRRDATRAMPVGAAAGGRPSPRPAARPRPRPTGARPPGPGRRPAPSTRRPPPRSSGLSGGALAAGLVALVAAFVVLALLLRGSPADDDVARVAVPPVVGLSAAAAASALTEAGLVAEQAEADGAPDDAAVGSVVGSDPGAGEEVDAGSTVRLDVVAPPDTVEVDAGDLVGRDVDDVTARLGELGLRVQRVDEPSDDADPGEVLRLNPTGAVAPGGVVTVVVASPLPSPTPAPSSAPAPSAPPATPDAPSAPSDDDDAPALPTSVPTAVPTPDLPLGGGG